MTVVIDGRTIEAHEGELLLDVLRRARHDVPTLCHDDVLEPYAEPLQSRRRLRVPLDRDIADLPG